MFIIPRNFWTSMISKKTLAITAIVLVAVVMVVGTIAPAMAGAGPASSPNPPISEKAPICGFVGFCECPLEPVRPEVGKPAFVPCFEG